MPQISIAQEGVGISYGRYNGLTASKLNPSFLLISKNKWEVQILGSHTFIDNSYGSVYNTNLLNLIKNGDNLNIPDQAYDNPSSAQQHDIIFNTAHKKTHLDFKSNIIGLGGFYKINKDIAVGVSSGIRSSLTADNIPSSLNYYNIIDLPGDSIFDLSAFQANGMVWTEYGFHYAHRLNENLKSGISIKYLNGYKSFSIDNNIEIEYIESADTLSALNAGQARFAYAELEDEEFDVVGSGFAINLGIELLNENGSFLGFSILDLGWVSLTGKNYLINFNEGQSIVYEDYVGFETIDQQIFQMLEDGFQIDSTENTTIALPTAFSIQYRKRLTPQFGIQAHLVQNLKLSDQQIKRSNTTTVSATYDAKHFSAFLPVTMYDYKNLSIGAAVRFGFLTIGSDRIFTLFKNQENFSGTDFYVNLKFYPFEIGKDDEDKINCFKF